MAQNPDVGVYVCSIASGSSHYRREGIKEIKIYVTAFVVQKKKKRCVSQLQYDELAETYAFGSES